MILLYSIFDLISIEIYLFSTYEKYFIKKSRSNLIDWDYHSNVKNVASIIHIKQFQEWRMSGIAFEFGDANYSSPNRSMATYARGKAKSGRDCGMFKEFQGFWLDILVGPFISHGVEIDSSDCDCDCPYVRQLFEVVNKGCSGAEQHRHHTVDVAMYNLLSYMWEIQVKYPTLKLLDLISIKIYL